MYRIPKNIDLSGVVGCSTTQLCVGQYDLQFSFGPVHFAIQSTVTLHRQGAVVTKWHEGIWPSPEFFEIMNVDVIRFEVPNDQTIVIHLANGIEIHLHDDSDQFESMQISMKGSPTSWII